MYRYLLLLSLFTLFAFAAKAQNPDTTSTATVKSKHDTLTATKQDTAVVSNFSPKRRKERIYHPDTTHSPRKAVIRSLIIPGWGQLYNHRWWKVPLVYAALGSIGWAYFFNAHYYREFLALSKYRNRGITPKLGDPYYTEYNDYINVPDQSIYDAKDGYRRNRDLSILGIVGFWGINAIDAYIDAKFIHSYAIDSNLSFKVAPGMLSQPMYAQNSVSSYIPGIKLTFTLR